MKTNNLINKTIAISSVISILMTGSIAVAQNIEQPGPTQIKVQEPTAPSSDNEQGWFAGYRLHIAGAVTSVLLPAAIYIFHRYTNVNPLEGLGRVEHASPEELFDIANEHMRHYGITDWSKTSDSQRDKFIESCKYFVSEGFWHQAKAWRERNKY